MGLLRVWDWCAQVVRAMALLLIAKAAVDIRLHAVHKYGRVIHEFDPWFNFRATEQLVRFQEQHGWLGGMNRFNTWYDDKVWSPLGRPVGTTIYPGMQVCAHHVYACICNILWHADYFCSHLQIRELDQCGKKGERLVQTTE